MVAQESDLLGTSRHLLVGAVLDLPEMSLVSRGNDYRQSVSTGHVRSHLRGALNAPELKAGVQTQTASEEPRHLICKINQPQSVNAAHDPTWQSKC